MLKWLNGTENRKDSPNENYGREMMELFTLGADRGAYSERDVREQARALTGFQNRWKPRRGRLRLPLRREAARHRHEDASSTSRASSTGRTRAGSACRTRRTRRSSSRSSGATSSPSPPSRSTAHGARGALQAGLRGAAGRRRDPRAPGAVRRPADGEAAGRPPRPGCCAGSARGITTTDWAWIGSLSGQQLFYPPNVAGWDDTRWLDTATYRGRWIAVQRMLRDQRISIPAKPPAGCRPTRRGSARPRARRSGATRRSSSGTHAALLRFAQRRAARRARPRSGSRRSTRCWSRTRFAT